MRSDFTRLKKGEWFTDNIIDGHNHLWCLAVSRHGFRVSHLSVLFYGQLLKYGPKSEQMQRWIKDIRIPSLNLFVLPIHTPDHYSLVLVYPLDKDIIYCDSMKGQVDTRKVLSNVVQFISSQYPNEVWKSWNMSEYNVSPLYKCVPEHLIKLFIRV